MITVAYDAETDVLTVEGVRYAGDFFRALAPDGPPNGLLLRVDRTVSGAVTFYHDYDPVASYQATFLRSTVCENLGALSTLGLSARTLAALRRGGYVRGVADVPRTCEDVLRGLASGTVAARGIGPKAQVEAARALQRLAGMDD